MSQRVIISLIGTVLLMYSVEASLFSASAHRELEEMKLRVDMVHDELISEECPDPDVQRTRRRDRDTALQISH